MSAILLTPGIRAWIPVPDPAPPIIALALAHRRATFATLPGYQYQLSVKFVVRDVDQAPDALSSIAQLSESRSTVSWQEPNHYHEAIDARRRTNHLTPVWNTIALTDIGNFQRDRFEIPPLSFVSPLADNAPAAYRFRVTDTLIIDGRRVIRVAITPRSDAAPTLAGTIDITDSTYDVVAIDVAVIDAPQFGLWKSLRYQQRYADAGDGHWLPAEIRLTGEARLPVRIPRTPRHLAFEQDARFTNYRLVPGESSADMREVRIAVADRADRAGDSVWAAPSSMPLSDAERLAWGHADSAARRSSSVTNRVQQVNSLSRWVSSSGEFFHFNRVDGAYLGAGSAVRPTPGLVLNTRLGYGTGNKRWQYRVGGDVQVSEAQRIWVGAAYHDETVSRPSLSGTVSDRSLQALIDGRDPLDYYGERGLTLAVSARPFDFTRLDLQYNDQMESNLPVTTTYALMPSNRPLRGNGLIVPGEMRTLSGTFAWDSRAVMRRNGRDSRLPATTWTRIMVSGEVAAPNLIPDDFNFGRFVLQVERHQRTAGLGITSVTALVGIGTGTVPPQRYFTVESGVRALGFQGGGFHTVGDTSYAGNRIAMLSVRHDFDRSFLAASGLPLLRKLPFTVSVFGAAFGIGFAYHTPIPGDSAFRTTTVPYTEAGFALGNLLPFIAPLNVGAQFTWQLSNQAVRRFQFGFDLRGP